MNSSNKTNCTEACQDDTNLWMICEGVVLLCTAVAVYVLVCLLYFSYLQRKKRKQPTETNHNLDASPHFNTNKSKSRRRSTYHDLDESHTLRRSSRRLKTWMLRFATSVPVIALIKYSVDQLKFFYAWNAKSNFTCEIVNDITEVGLYGMSLNGIYGFLWMRQWLFYNNPAVRGLLYRKHLIRFSKGMLITILTVNFVTVIFHILPQKYAVDTSFTYKGCISIYDLQNPGDAWAIISYITLTSIFQLSLLGLFVYPFVRRKIDSRLLKRAAKTRKNENELSSKKNSNNIKTTNMVTSLNCIGNKNCISSSLHPMKHSPNNTKENANNEQQRNSAKIAFMRSLRVILCLQTGTKKTETPVVNVAVTLVRNSNDDKVFRSVRRVVFWCAMCILSDITMVIVAVSKGPGTSLILITTLNNVNILINMVCIVVTYGRWRHILWPFTCDKTRNNKIQQLPILNRRHCINENNPSRYISEGGHSKNFGQQL